MISHPYLDNRGIVVVMREDIERFVASLAIPADRKAVVLSELVDHVACARDAAVREGRDPDVAGRDALGNLDALRRSLEAIEPAFRVSRLQAFVRGLIGAVLVAIVVDQTHAIMMGALAAITSLAIAVVCAPPRALELLRAELRAPRIRRSVRIGPALIYGFTVMSVPGLIWTAMILKGIAGGLATVETPWSAFAVGATGYALLLVESVRARRQAIA
jgi:hypothetical protein